MPYKAPIGFDFLLHWREEKTQGGCVVGSFGQGPCFSELRLRKQNFPWGSGADFELRSSRRFCGVGKQWPIMLVQQDDSPSLQAS